MNHCVQSSAAQRLRFSNQCTRNYRTQFQRSGTSLAYRTSNEFWTFQPPVGDCSGRHGTSGKMTTPLLLESSLLPIATSTAGTSTTARRQSSVARASTHHAAVLCSAGSETDNQLGRRKALIQLAILPATTFATGGGPAWWCLPSCATEDRPPIEEVKNTIIKDITEGQYYVTGNLTRSIYDDNCKFTDPTTVVSGVDKYVAAIQFLFEPQLSKHELLAIEVSSPSTVDVKWRLEGYLKFPWRPHILPYEGSTRYTLNSRGLVVSHDETWDISLWTALLEFITPSWQTPL